MSTSAIAPPANHWALWRAQTLTILATELRKNFLSRRSIWLYAGAALPVILVWMHSLVEAQHPGRMRHDLPVDVGAMAVLFQVFFLRPALFFGCLGLFTWLFRGEFVERSMHYYFLAPVRREVLVVGKYLAGVVTSVSFFGLSIVLTFFGMFAHYPQFQVREWMIAGPGLGQLGAYLTITILACLAWGSIFLWMGIRYRNPIVPAVVFLTWETAISILPSWLRRVSVLHYLQSLNPTGSPASEGPALLLGVTAEPEPAAVAVICLLLITAAFIALSARTLKRSEITYSVD